LFIIIILYFKIFYILYFIFYNKKIFYFITYYNVSFGNNNLKIKNFNIKFEIGNNRILILTIYIKMKKDLQGFLKP